MKKISICLIVSLVFVLSALNCVNSGLLKKENYIDNTGIAANQQSKTVPFQANTKAVKKYLEIFFRKVPFGKPDSLNFCLEKSADLTAQQKIWLYIKTVDKNGGTVDGANIATHLTTVDVTGVEKVDCKDLLSKALSANFQALQEVFTKSVISEIAKEAGQDESERKRIQNQGVTATITTQRENYGAKVDYKALNGDIPLKDLGTPNTSVFS